MPYKPLISTDELDGKMLGPDWLIIDCRFALADPEKGRRDYFESHIPGARYAHLDEDLSGPIIPGVTGRHPLPEIEAAARTFSRWGIMDQTNVVAYDDAGGALAAGRLWWLLRWLGHQNTFVLDGGWQKWLGERRSVTDAIPDRKPAAFTLRLQSEKVVSSAEVEKIRQDLAYKLIDVRAAERFRGQNELIDPVAGHIPGALSAPYIGNLNQDLTFRSPGELQQIYRPLLGETPENQAVFYCGSGVTATHSILAMMQAGLGEARLYAGSWSEWIADARRPVATGDSL